MNGEHEREAKKVEGEDYVQLFINVQSIVKDYARIKNKTERMEEHIEDLFQRTDELAKRLGRMEIRIIELERE